MNNALGGIAIGANHVEALGDGTYGPNDVDGVIVRSQAVDHDATWAALDAPYVATDGFDVQATSGSAKLTVSAGATLEFGDGAILAVRDNGGLTLDGTAASHVTVTSAKASPAAGDWGEIDLYSASSTPDNVFHYTDISYGGGNSDGQLWVDDGAGVTLDNVTFANAACDVLLAGSMSSVDPTASTYTTCM